MPFRQLGTRTIVLTTGLTAKTTGAWIPLGAAYSRFGLRVVRGGSVGTSAFSVTLQGSLSTRNTTGAAVGAIGAYVPSALVVNTQAAPGPGKLKLSTALLPASFIRFSSTTFTTAAGRTLRIEVVAIP